ncbi:lens fiber major intrinsic protein-like [Diadema antillarum]|uniref:lens fiber major intrinsic protein-like n=1 Tax=Diadema antillarum TaxID=105358 RepID=UPI003A8A48E2
MAGGRISVRDELRSVIFWQAVLAEFVGMFFFIFIGVSSISAWDRPNIPSQVQISLAFGLGLATFVHVTAHISGGHLNPAVSLAFLAMHKISPVRCLAYTLAQIVGAIIAAGMVKAVTPAAVAGGIGATTPGTDVADWQAFLMEVFLTAQLVIVIFATVDSRRKSPGGSGPLAIGISVAVAHLAAVSIP